MSTSIRIPPPRLGRGRLTAVAHRFLARHSDALLVAGARQLAEASVTLLHSENPDPRTNGERWVVERLADRLDTVVDVGANHGIWSRQLLDVAPGAQVWCSELVGPTREALRAALPTAKVVDYGLSERSGTVRVKHYRDDDRLSSLYDYPHPLPAVWLTEEVRTGDELLEAEGIDTVDFLKIDAEGADLAVLRGFCGALDQNRIRAVQFEYGYASVLAHTFLLDFYELLEPRGFHIGRVGRNRVDFARYRLERENFFGPNFLALLAGDIDAFE